jgi:hypothetical protein
MPEEYTTKANRIIDDLLGDTEICPSSPVNFDKTVKEDRKYAEQVVEYASNPDSLHNDRAPSTAIQKETPEHRHIVTLKAMGMTNGEIAEATGRTNANISTILRQPWARQRLVKLISDAGKDPLKVILESAAVDSIQKLIELRDDPSTPKPVVKASCDSLLDRFLGKPTQHIESKSEVTNVPADLKRIEEELAAVAAEEQRLGVSRNN